MPLLTVRMAFFIFFGDGDAETSRIKWPIAGFTARHFNNPTAH